MEWAKLESRCPMCKRRFTTIRRPPKDGVFPFERLVQVPVRDQVYHPLGNTTISHTDPYESAHCSVCHGMADEHLLLLCDLCDSPSHSYCVGLGNTVPEGDWFCHDCTVSRADHANSDSTVSRADHANSEIDIDCGSQNESRESCAMQSADPHVSIFDIVRDSNTIIAEGPPCTTASSHINHSSSTAVSDREINVINEVAEPGARAIQGGADKLVKSGARTLNRCRNVHVRIQAIRDNWNALRTGSLSFSSSSVASGAKTGHKLSNGAIHCKSAGQPRSSSSTNCQPSTTRSSSSTNCQPSTTREGGSGNTSQNRGSYDIEKAWKMMDIAKSVQRPRGKIIKSIQHSPESMKIVHLSAKCSIGKGGHSPKEASNIRIGSTDKRYKYCLLENKNEENKSQKYEKLKESPVTTIGTLKINENFQTTHSEGLSSSRKIQTPVPVNSFYGNGEDLLQKSLNGVSLHATNERDGSAHMISPVTPVKRSISDSSNGKPKLLASSSCKVQQSRGKITKSIQHSPESMKIVHQSSNCSIGKGGHSPKEASNVRIGSTDKHYKYCLLENKNEENTSQKYLKQKGSRVNMNGTLKINEVFQITHSEGLLSSRKIQTPVRVNSSYGNEEGLLQKSSNGASLHATNERDGPARMISLVTPNEASSHATNMREGPTRVISPVTPVKRYTSDLSNGNPEPIASCSRKVNERVKKSSLEGKSRKEDDDAKSEIRSLVKLNLKLLCRNKQLGVNEFKEVARLATHKIMAACGLEKPKSGEHSLPDSVCFHTELVQPVRKSTLMPSSCRECFYFFVKDVVNSIMIEKVS